MRRIQLDLLALVAVQAVHSVEDTAAAYGSRLAAGAAGERADSAMASRIAVSLIGNLAHVAFGVWCFLWPIRARLGVRDAWRGSGSASS